MHLQSLCEQFWQATSYNHLFLSIFFFLLFLLKSKRCTKLNLPPSPPKLPIIGNLHQLGKFRHHSLRDLSHKYGPLMMLQLGQISTLVISSADMAKEIIKTHDIVFSNRPRTTAPNIFFYGCKDVLFSPYGDYWRQVKRISVLEIFTHKRVKSFQLVREEEIEHMINRVRNACLNEDSVNLSEMIFGITNNIVSRCVLGPRAVEENHTNKFGALFKRFMVQLEASAFGDIFLCLAWMDVLTGLIGRLKATFTELDAFLDQVIEEHRTSNSYDTQYDRQDFVDILLQLQKDGDHLEIELLKDNLKAILVDMFVGGTDTTATTIEWAMAELIKNPNIMKKAQQEVRSVVGKKSRIDVKDINQMDYLKCIIKETMRLHPPAPFLVPRETSASAKLGGYDIPPRTRVLINVWAIQKDPGIWDKPEEFIPERFENNPIDRKGLHFQLIPFGAGRRGCPGISFALATAEYMIANLLYWFDWKIAAGQTLDMSEVYGIVAHKKFPLRLLPISCCP
ncbi:cytochrome P450 71A1-like [Pistacia vera]|uniref:cytochrome P450 71A1-like n=1 Tax=Pistacia vera TaxID=55513 RepID=UPI001263E6BB|nr:cytochrome P450 71A1-like [Pistacia vera]